MSCYQTLEIRNDTAANDTTANDTAYDAATANDSLSFSRRDNSFSLGGRKGGLCIHMRGQLHTVGCLVERTVKGRDKEYEHLCTHTDEQHQVGSRQVGQFKERTQNND